MRLVRFENDHGEPVAINVDHVATVVPAYGTDALAAIWLTLNDHVVVKGSFDEVVARLEGSAAPHKTDVR